MRKIMDCRTSPDSSGCTLTISGEEDEVLRAAAQHAADVHGMKDTPQNREKIRASLENDYSSDQGVQAPSP